MHAMIVIMSC